MESLENNVFDTALIFEGGGMRASYTCAVVNVLLENGIYFDNVYGISAGSSNTANYISRDIWRAKESFVDFIGDPQMGNWGTWLQHKGYFNAQYIYEESGKPEGVLPFDFETFMANPAKMTIAGFRRDTGETIYWTKDDMFTLGRLMRRVRASSTLPMFMVPPDVDGFACYDGGLGEGAGLILPRAQRDGFEKFFIVRTQPRAYRKKEGGNPLGLVFARRPHVRKALDTRPVRYNAICDEIERLEAEGKAYVFYAEGITAKSGTEDVALLEENYQMGYARAMEELPRMKEFLGLA
ncbi:MAG: patatin-like phospholipase family protein [Coriobacteriales bacterium]|jgi:predicted patatin/cPLA2 family phospholipase